jgi:hypothetical protein
VIADSVSSADVSESQSADAEGTESDNESIIVGVKRSMDTQTDDVPAKRAAIDLCSAIAAITYAHGDKAAITRMLNLANAVKEQGLDEKTCLRVLSAL